MSPRWGRRGSCPRRSLAAAAAPVVARPSRRYPAHAALVFHPSRNALGAGPGRGGPGSKGGEMHANTQAGTVRISRSRPGRVRVPQLGLVLAAAAALAGIAATPGSAADTVIDLT